MPSLTDHFESGAQALRPLRELRVSAEASFVSIFTDEIEEVQLHYVQDPGWKRYVVCPGPGCPLCRVACERKRFLLLPVLDATEKAVVVLRIPDDRGPDSLGILIIPFLKDPNISENLLLLSRGPDFKFHIETRTLARDYDCGEKAIVAFGEARKNGLKLATAFPNPTPAQIAEIDSVRRRLELLGGSEG